MLEIKNLSVNFGDKELLHDINMTVEPGERRLIAGHNGSGKSTLVNVIAGNCEYKITSGQIILNGHNITNENATTRSLLGIFLGAQNVPEIPGLTVISFLKHIAIAHTQFQTGKNLSMGQFLADLEIAREKLDIPKAWLNRSINVGFSGGERKRLMLLRLLIIKPKLAIMDEPDSGADKMVQQQIVNIIKEMSDTTFMFISHQNEFTSLLNPDKTTTLSGGKIMI